MPHFSSAGVEIAYEVEGEGKPILLVHGFSATAADNWVRTGWVQALTRARYKVVTFDLRGHGASQKLYEADDYDIEKMAGDALALMDHLGIEKTDLMGFSMGAGIAMRLAARHGTRFGKVVLAGMGAKAARARQARQSGCRRDGGGGCLGGVRPLGARLPGFTRKISDRT